MSHHIVEVRDLCYQYAEGTAALQGVSFRIAHGEAVAIVGANGAGKSTLLQHLTGCLLAQKGSVQVGETILEQRTLPIIRRSVGMVFQDADDQLFMPTVFDDVAFGPVNMGLPPEQVQARVDNALTTVGMSHLAQRAPYRLSGGEKRAVAIATVLAMSPDVLVMDEPSAGLDPRARRRLIGMLAGFEHTRIIATHDLDMALEFCSRTIVLHGGTVAADGATLDVLTDAAILNRCGLEKPLSLGACPVCSKSGHATRHEAKHL